MAKVNLVSKKITMDLWNIIKFQLLTHGYIQGIPLSESELNCLTLLGINKESELSDFCNASCSEEQRDKEPALEYKSHIFKNRKKIFLSENLKIQILGNIVLDYKVICLDTKKI